MVHFETSQRQFQRRFQRRFQRYTQPYPSSDVAVWKTGQGRDKEYVLRFTQNGLLSLWNVNINV